MCRPRCRGERHASEHAPLTPSAPITATAIPHTLKVRERGIVGKLLGQGGQLGISRAWGAPLHPPCAPLLPLPPPPPLPPCPVEIMARIRLGPGGTF